MEEHVAQAARFSHYTYAIVVGIIDYHAKGLEDLPACTADAEALESTLTDSAGCAIPLENVLRLPDQNATAAAILDALAWLVQGRTAYDTLVIYFAGHGAVRDGQFFFLTGSNDKQPGVAASALDELLSTTQLRGVLLIVDCCGGADLAAHAPSFFRTSHGSDFRLFLSASRAGQSSWEFSESRKSLFTSRLLTVLRGEVVLGEHGTIYYLELYQYLHTAVQEDAERFLGSRERQEPVSVGSHVGNPLLFLHRDLSLSEVRVKTQKVTREYLLRRLRFTVLSVLVAGALGVGAYWAFLDGHQYLQLDNTVVLVHGYPGLSGFGLPKEDWRFPFGADALLSSHPLSRTPVVLPRSVNAEEQLALALRPGSRALVRVWAGKYAEARDILLSSRGTPDWGNDGIMALKGVTVAGHEAQLIKLIPKLSPDESVAAILALAKSDPERAITAFRSSPAGAVAGLELTVLASWSARCTPAVQKWLDSFSGRKGWVPVKTIATTAVISGCVFPEDLLYQNSSATRDAMMALRLTSPARAAELGAQLKAELERIAGANVLNPSDRRTFLTGSAVALFTLNASRYLETVPCLPKLLQTADYGQTDEVAREARIASALLIVRGCKDYRLSIEPQAQALSVGILSPQESRTEIARVSLIPPVSADILPLLDAMIKFRAQGVSQALEAVLNTMPDGLLRSALIERLAFLNETHTDPIQWRLPDQPMLDRAILSLLARQDSQRTSAWFRSLFAQQPDSTLVEALEWVPLTPEDKVAIRLSAEHYSPLLRTMTLALIGEPEVVARLLTDRRPEIRAWAAQYAPLRSDWELIRARTQELGRYPGEVLAKATATREELEQLSVWIARTPAWDREWFLGTLEHDRANNSAAQLHLSKLRRAYALAP